MSDELIGIGAGLAQSIGQGIFGVQQGQKQFDRQKKLQEQNAQIQRDNWDYTNMENQRKHMEKAGLNVGLMYGMGGAGGATMGSGSAGSAGTVQTPQATDIANTILQNKQTESMLKLQEAQARRLNAEAEDLEMDVEVKKTYGKDANLWEEDNRGRKAKAEGIIMHGETKDEKTPIDGETRTMRNLINENKVKDAETRIKTETEETVKAQMRQDLINSKLDEALKEAGIELTREQERKIWHDIWQGWTNAGFNGLGKIINGMILNKMKK